MRPIHQVQIKQFLRLRNGCLVQENSIPRFEKNFLEVTYLPLHHFYTNTQICSKESYEKSEQSVHGELHAFAHYIFSASYKSRRKTKRKEPGNEKKDEKKCSWTKIFESIYVVILLTEPRWKRCFK